METSEQRSQRPTHVLGFNTVNKFLHNRDYPRLQLLVGAAVELSKSGGRRRMTSEARDGYFAALQKVTLSGVRWSIWRGEYRGCSVNIVTLQRRRIDIRLANMLDQKDRGHN
jgi:hypothetical protein